MRVGDDAFQNGNVEKSIQQVDTGPIRIGQGGLGVEVGIVGIVGLRGVDVLAENGEAGTGAADRNAAPDRVVDRGLHRRIHPVTDVVGLVSAGNEDGAGATDGFGDEWIRCGFAAGDDEGGDGVEVA